MIESTFEALFAERGSRFGEYKPVSNWVEVIPGAVQRREVHRAGDDSERYELTIFQPIEGLAAELWEHEVRSLVSLSAMSHPSLPEIVDGGAADDWKLAFSRTRSTGQVLEQDGAIVALRADPVEALRQFDSVLDAVRRLHDHRILHRNVCPDALRFVGPELDGTGNVIREPRIMLTRFEMSTLISNLVRGSSLDSTSTTEQLRVLLRGPDHGPNSRAAPRIRRAGARPICTRQ